MIVSALAGMTDTELLGMVLAACFVTAVATWAAATWRALDRFDESAEAEMTEAMTAADSKPTVQYDQDQDTGLLCTDCPEPAVGRDLIGLPVCAEHGATTALVSD